VAQIRITGLGRDARDIPGETLDALAARLEGTLIFPDDEGFAEAILIWNGMIKKQPALVVRPSSTKDVVQTVDFVRDNELVLSIKGGGHNIAGLALSDGGITLDMSGMRAVEVDVEARLARVGPGCTLGDVDQATQVHGLASTLGFVSATGVAGLTLGGGFGYLTRRFGWTVDDLEEVEIVTVDGQVRCASRADNDDLFWALRGGGGNFGVVTEFVLRLHAVGPQVTAGIIAWPASEAEAVLQLYRRTVESSPRELTTVVLRRNAPPAPWLPEAAHGTPIQAMARPDSGADDANREWVRSAWRALKPYSTGGNYVNFQTEEEADERTFESYRDNYQRLATIKAKYDPSNLFRVNRNIRPLLRAA